MDIYLSVFYFEATFLSFGKGIQYKIMLPSTVMISGTDLEVVRGFQSKWEILDKFDKFGIPYLH